jgi:superfamily II DNA or RNA helicase
VHTLPLPGDLVWIRQKRWRIERVRRDRNVVRLDVASRDARLTFLAPFDRPTSISRSDRLKRVRPQQALARLAHLLGRTYGIRTMASAVDADLAILPHQLEPALAVVRGARRVLVADEVGLGKTIQAGLVAAEILRRDPAARVLIVVPASLRSQWADELRLRFRILASAADARTIDESGRTGAFAASPWDRPGVWIASLDFLKQSHVIDALPLRPWDLVVVDEAHTACGDSVRHEACHELLQRARRCVLLTATPHSGDETRFARLLGLGRLDNDTLTIFRRTRQDLNLTGRRRLRWQGVAVSPAERRVLAALGAFERAVLRAAGQAGRDRALLLLSVFRKRALSTMGALSVSLDRRIAYVGDSDADDLDWLQPSLAFEDESDDLEDDERIALTASSGMRAAHERSWLRRIRALVEQASRVESKVAHLAAVLRRTAEPVVIFTEFRHSLEVLERRLRLMRSLAVLHGGQTELERRQQLRHFLDGTASVLLATDVAGQGLNLQKRARWVVGFELPWNPARIEQRIGRVDRIGQDRPVHATLLISRDPAEAGLLANLARRTLSARRALGDDVLDLAAPDERALCAALIDQAPPATLAAPAPVPICRVWQRHARFIARRLQSARALVARWRSPADGTRALRARLAHAAVVGLPPGAAVLFVFSLPVLDRVGSVIERHVVAVASRSFNGGMAAEIEAARARAAHARVRRLARAELLARSMSANAAKFDRALFAELEELVPREAQAGLFDNRELQTFEAGRQAGLAMDDELAAASERRGRQCTLECGRPVLELVFIVAGS